MVVVAGNPNTGKTTLFNKLTGQRLKVGNYPGITIDRHLGKIKLTKSGDIELADVPGAYSLAARSEEEQIALLASCGSGGYPVPDVVLVVVDATQLTRNLYLVVQLLELGRPVVVALNMVDRLHAPEERINAEAMEKALGVPVVPISAKDGQGTDQLLLTIDRVLQDPTSAICESRWKPNETLARDVEAVRLALPEDWHCGDDRRSQAVALWALLSVDDDDELKGIPDNVRECVAARRELAAKESRDIDEEIVRGRFDWIDRVAPTFLQEFKQTKSTRSERLDSLLLNPWTGFPLFLLAMGVLFQSLFSWADPGIGAVETAFGWLGGKVGEWLPEGFFRDLITEGIIAGVGSVVVFLPQILLLFLFVTIMEASGYMARVAFLMDRIMRLMGLNGKAFVPMLSGFACAIPAIMATRTMERRRDRLVTMMVVPLMTCSARLPVYTLIIATLFPANMYFGMPVQGLLMVFMYVFSTVIALAAAAVLSRTLLKGPSVPLLMELPPYRMPDLRTVLRETWEKGRVFLTEAGTVILVCTIGLWLLLSFPKDAELDAPFDERRAVAEQTLTGEAQSETLAVIDQEQAASHLRNSYAGQMGRSVEPALRPLGFDWKIGVGLIGAFAAREVFVSTMGLVYGVGADVDEGSSSLRDRIRNESHKSGEKVYTPLVGMSLMIFFALACQCMATIAVVRRETDSWFWPLFMFGYMTALAWGASFLTYQGGLLLGFE
ncbi:MAG: ferrous iron transport protein B [Planctomycetota bacterium]|nr:ferrous iron transport protein B [Planctomycetota bacterium]